MPSLNALGTALLACAGSAVATQFTLSETYDHTNFFDKFTFFDDADTNSGFVVYENQANAMAQGLAKITSNNEVYLGVDHTTKLKGSGFAGRSSIRLESKDSYTHGLIVARFTHLPANKCGSWPSFWTLGDNWPNGGEIDVYEGWNNIVDNQPAFHVGSSALYGECTLANAGQSSPVATSNCDNTFQSPPSQYLNQGCTATDSTGPWASANGGTYAIEWTSDYIKLYNWARGAEPANLATSQPDTATWGTPVVNLQNSNCNIDRHFGSQRMILDIDFCGNPVGTPAYWQQSCSKTTGQATCADYVSNFPGDFAQTFFQIEDIRYFSQSTSKPTSSSAVHSSTKASSSVVHSSTKASSSVVHSSTKASSSVVHSTSSAAHSTVKASSSPAGASSPVVVPTSVIQSQSAATPTISFSDSSSAAAVTGHPTSKWTNSSITVTSAAQMTTSTVYTTSLRTITQCPPEVTNCPTRPKTVTDTIALYTTICPVLAAESSSAALAAESTASPSAPAVSAYVPPSGPETITTEITRVHTITSCAPEVTNCPARLSTEIIRTSYPAGQPTGVPVAPSAPAYPAPPAGSGPQESSPAAGYPVPSSPAGAPAPVETVPVAPVGAPSSVPVVPVAPVAPVGAPSSVPVAPAAPIDTPTNIPVGPGSVPMNGTWSTTVVSKPSSVPQGGAAPSVQPPVPVSSGLGSAGCTGTDCLPPVGSGAVRTGMSTLALVGAMVAMLL